MRTFLACASVLGLAWMASGCGRSYVGSADATVTAFVPDGAEVHATHRAEFQVDDRTVALTHVEYGELMDCSSGCFASHVCAIEDGASVLLYDAAWYGEAERPLGIDEICPELGTSTDTRHNCEPPGRTHPVTSTPEFAAFVDEQVGRGELRFCFGP